MSDETRHRTRFAGLPILGIAVTLAGADLGVKAYATNPEGLGSGSVDLGLLQLRLAYNSGVAFSLGADGSDTLILIGTSVVVVALGVFAWRAAASLPLLGRLGLASLLGGAVGNLLDRGRDGVVTDYLYTGWWPTFNLADVFITVGAGALLVAHFRAGSSPAPAIIDDSAPIDGRVDRPGR